MAIIDKSFEELTGKLAMMSASVAQGEADIGGTFEWDGNVIPCVVTKQFAGKSLDVAGWVNVRKCKFRCRTVNLPNPAVRPATNDVVKVRASTNGILTTYRVKYVEPIFDICLDISCEDTNQ